MDVVAAEDGLGGAAAVAPEVSPQLRLELFVLEGVDEGADAAVEVDAHHRQMIPDARETHAVAEVEEEEENLIGRVADDVGDEHAHQRLQRVAFRATHRTIVGCCRRPRGSVAGPRRRMRRATLLREA